MPEISGGWRVQIARPGLTAFLWSTPYSGGENGRSHYGLEVEEGAEALFDAVAFKASHKSVYCHLRRKEDGSLRARTSVLTFH